jgi:hypothetical protein
VVEFDLNVAYVDGRSAADQQAGEGGAGDVGRVGGHEIVRGLRLELAGTRGARQGRDFSVGIARAEEEGKHVRNGRRRRKKTDQCRGNC